MKINNNFLFALLFGCVFFVASCTGRVSETPSAQTGIPGETLIPTTVSFTPTHLSNIRLTNPITSTMIPLGTESLNSDCTSLSLDYIHIIDNEVYDKGNPGVREFGILGAIDVMQKALETHHPEWAQNTWLDSTGAEQNLAYYFWNTSSNQQLRMNPRVMLVTAGVAFDWQVPTGSSLDLNSLASPGLEISQHYTKFLQDENLRNQYPDISNAATYALYALFDHDLEKLQTWANAYDQLFGNYSRFASNHCQMEE